MNASFAYELKAEICRNAPQSGILAVSMTYGMAVFAHAFGQKEIVLQTEHPDIAGLFSRNVEQLTGQAPIYTQKHNPAITTHTVRIDDRAQLQKLMDRFGHGSWAHSLHIGGSILQNQSSAASFLAGAFLSCGNVTDPAKGYHLEFVTPRLHLCRELADIISQTVSTPKITTRRGNNVVYFKESVPIEDMMTLMGASESTLRLIDTKIYKDLRNKVNRQNNCDTANIGKTADAAAQQLENINLIAAERGLNSLPDGLRQVAMLRVENPEMSLREIGEALEPPVSRGGVSHRMRKIAELAAEIKSGDRPAER